ncbi:MAG: DUF4296 domain-containing protein [Tannerellaceae bacterium]|jgi:hypothetical protein|nr:DUF4296 domain-containing protein [Tannerellaceae bacterium]
MQARLHNHSRLFFLLASVILLTAACSKVPGGILPENKMKDVMVDVHIAEQIMSENSIVYSDSLQKAALMESVFRKHNITQAVYDSSLVWYGKNLNIMLQVLDLAIKEVDTRMHAYNELQAVLAPPPVPTDSVNIWTQPALLSFSPQSLFNAITFDIRPEGAYVSGSVFVLNLSVWGLHPRLNRLPELKIAAEHSDTTVLIRDTISADGFHSFTLRTVATKPVRRVYGYIRMDKAEAPYHKIYLDSLSLIRFNYGSK